MFPINNTRHQQPRWCLAAILFVFSHVSFAFTITLDDTDVTTTTVFSNVDDFNFSIEISDPLQTGAYIHPTIAGVDYTVIGSLVAGTPSMFPAFALHRPEPGNPAIGGTEFYGQGSSLQFEIAPGADLSDGLQVSELAVLSDIALPSIAGPDPLLTDITGPNPVFVFNGREVEDVTGFSRFHPTLLVLNSDGTGSIRNSNNIVNKNGFTEIPFGSEYVTTFTFDPSALTLSADTAAIPLPGTALLFAPSLLIALIPTLRRRSRYNGKPCRIWTH